MLSGRVKKSPTSGYSCQKCVKSAGGYVGRVSVSGSGWVKRILRGRSRKIRLVQVSVI